MGGGTLVSDPIYVTNAKLALAIGKRVLLVEGPDDEAVYTKWLEKLDSLFAARLRIIDCGGQHKITTALTLLKNAANVFAIQDRDQWDAAKIAQVRANHPRLLVNASRHTLESYFCDPAEVSAALLNKDPAYAALLPALTADVAAALSEWVDHWALWTALMRVQNRMVEEKMPYFFNQVVPIPSDATIRIRLQNWRAILDDLAMFNDFDMLRAYGRAQTRPTQLQSCVYAPEFFRLIVHPALRRIKPDDERTWMVNLAEWAPTPPGDLLPLLQALLV